MDAVLQRVLEEVDKVLATVGWSAPSEAGHCCAREAAAPAYGLPARPSSEPSSRSPSQQT